MFQYIYGGYCLENRDRYYVQPVDAFVISLPYHILGKVNIIIRKDALKNQIVTKKKMVLLEKIRCLGNLRASDVPETPSFR